MSTATTIEMTGPAIGWFRHRSLRQPVPSDSSVLHDGHEVIPHETCAVPGCTNVWYHAFPPPPVPKQTALETAWMLALADEYKPPKLSTPAVGMSLISRFICRFHTRAEQVAEVRKYDPARDDRADRYLFQEYQFDPGINRGLAVFSQLTKSFDAKESFMTGGHQPLKTRSNVERVHDTPEWMYNDQKVLEFLKWQFPGLGHDGASVSCPCIGCRRLFMAGKWLEVIWRYFRMHQSAAEIEDENPALAGQVDNIARAIRKAAAGDRKPIGRPKQYRL